MSETVFRRRVVGVTVRVEGQGVVTTSTENVAFWLLAEALRESRQFPPPQAIQFELQPEGEPWSRYEADNDWVTVGLVFAPQGSEEDASTLVRLLCSIRDSIPRIRAALPADHAFDAEAFASAIDRLRSDAPRTRAAFDARQEELARGELAVVQRAHFLDREVRSQMRWELTTPLLGARVDGTFESPHNQPLYTVAEALCLALLEADVRTPGYDEIRFVVAPSFDEAWDHLWSDLVWHRNVAVVVNTEVPSDAVAAHDVLAEPIAKAFRDLARVDGLDAVAVEGVLERFRGDGLRGKFLISRSEENGLDARVHARVAGLWSECTLDVTRAATGESVSVPLEPIDSWGGGPLRFQKVVTLGDRIRILGSAGPGRSADRRVEWSPVKELPLDELFR